MLEPLQVLFPCYNAEKGSKTGETSPIVLNNASLTSILGAGRLTPEAFVTRCFDADTVFGRSSNKGSSVGSRTPEGCGIGFQLRPPRGGMECESSSVFA